MSFKAEALSLLIEHGCPVDAANEEGDTASWPHVVEHLLLS